MSRIFIALLLAVGWVDTYAQSVKLEWSRAPGAAERHLMRRIESPYFPAERRLVSPEELRVAQQIDRRSIQQCREASKAVTERSAALPRPLTIVSFSMIRERLEAQEVACIRADGQGAMFAKRLEMLRISLINELRITYASEKDILRSIGTADNFHRNSVRIYYIPIIQQILQGGVIPAEDVVPAILSQNAAVLKKIVAVVPDPAKTLLVVESLKSLRETFNGGYQDPEIMEKIDALTLE